MIRSVCITCYLQRHDARTLRCHAAPRTRRRSAADTALTFPHSYLYFYSLLLSTRNVYPLPPSTGERSAGRTAGIPFTASLSRTAVPATLRQQGSIGGLQHHHCGDRPAGSHLRRHRSQIRGLHWAHYGCTGDFRHHTHLLRVQSCGTDVHCALRSWLNQMMDPGRRRMPPSVHQSRPRHHGYGVLC